MSQQNLGLDEALITVNKTNIRTPLDFYYQIDECYGCPLDKLKTLPSSSHLDHLILGTKYKLHLELRELNTSRLGLSCRFNNVELNSHGHYRIDVTKANRSHIDPLECSLHTLDKGDCLLCPMALLLCFIFLVTAAEKLYARYMTTTNSRSRARSGSQKVSSAGEEAGDNEAPDDTANCEQQVENATATAAAEPSEAERSQPEQLSQRLQQTGGSRVESLDAFRGLTIAGMIMVNYGGAGYVWLEHKPWDGITLADFVFPFFIFSMGASIALSSRQMIKRGKSFGEILLKILRRSFILMALGLCLNSKWLNGSNLSHLRLTGVLQRFSISYLVVALMYSMELAVDKWIKAQSLYRVPFMSHLVGGVFELLTALNYLAIYLYVTFYLEYSATCPAGYLGPGGLTEGGQFANCTGGAAAWLDKLLLGESHLYNDREVKHIFKTSVTHDPEGLLGFTTSILLTLIGLQCGKILVRFKLHKSRLLMFLQWFAILAICCVAVVQIPINKRLWSLTFVTLTGAFAYLVVALLYLIMDVYNCQRTFFLRLLVSAGKNSIFLYVAHSLLSGMLPWHFEVDESSHFQLLIRLVWSTLVWLLVAHFMASKRLFIKI